MLYLPAKPKRMQRPERKLQILSVMYYWLYKDGLTMREVAVWCQVAPSTHLMSILRELQAEGFIKSLEVPHRPNISKFVWLLTDNGVALAKYHITNDWSAK